MPTSPSGLSLCYTTNIWCNSLHRSEEPWFCWIWLPEPLWRGSIATQSDGAHQQTAAMLGLGHAFLRAASAHTGAPSSRVLGAPSPGSLLGADVCCPHPTQPGPCSATGRCFRWTTYGQGGAGLPALPLHVPAAMIRGWWDPGVPIPPISPAQPQQYWSRHQLHRRGGKVLPAWSQLGTVMPLVSRNIWALTSLISWEMDNFINAVGAHLFLLHTALLMPSAAPGIHAHSCLWIS